MRRRLRTRQIAFSVRSIVSIIARALAISAMRPTMPSRLARRDTRVLALIALGLAWELGLAPTGRGTLAVKVLPLLLPLPGLLRMRLYTYRWLSLAIWIYATEGAVRATSERGVSASLAWVELALSLVL